MEISNDVLQHICSFLYFIDMNSFLNANNLLIEDVDNYEIMKRIENNQFYFDNKHSYYFYYYENINKKISRIHKIKYILSARCWNLPNNLLEIMRNLKDNVRECLLFDSNSDSEYCNICYEHKLSKNLIKSIDSKETDLFIENSYNESLSLEFWEAMNFYNIIKEIHAFLKFYIHKDKEFFLSVMRNKKYLEFVKESKNITIICNCRATLKEYNYKKHVKSKTHIKNINRKYYKKPVYICSKKYLEKIRKRGYMYKDIEVAAIKDKIEIPYNFFYSKSEKTIGKIRKK